jgi:hypothetical protein
VTGTRRWLLAWVVTSGVTFGTTGLPATAQTTVTAGTITVLDLFQNPTVGALARFLSQDTAEDREKGQERIEERSRKLLDARARKQERMREIKNRN